MFFVEETILRLSSEFGTISKERKVILNDIASLVDRGVLNWVFICTHNSRRSHIAQIWAATAASYFNAKEVQSYSGGTESTAFNLRAVNALREIGFRIDEKSGGMNPHYEVRYADELPAIEIFSKKYDDESNPSHHFAAIMTCTHADENCPVVAGATARISLPYDDPKDFDGTKMETSKYRERSLEIGREILYVFSQIRRA